MRILAVAVLLFACGKDAPRPDRWPEVERIAKPTVPAADATLLTQALGRMTNDDVPEMALEDAIAWRKAGGGLPWRGMRAVDDWRPLQVMKLGRALVERRATDPEALLTALYLGHRMRAEGAGMIDAAVGFALAKLVTESGTATAEHRALAPTEGEARRAVAADAVQFVAIMDGPPEQDDQAILGLAKKTYAEIVLGPADRAGYIKHVETLVAKAQKSEVLSIIIAPRISQLVTEMFAGVDAYAAWADQSP